MSVSDEDKVEAVGLAHSIGLRNGGIALTQWEEEFVESAGDRLSEGGTLTEKQQDILDKLYDRT